MKESRHISAGGAGNSEWTALLAETRHHARVVREIIRKAQLQKEEQQEQQERQQQEEQEQEQQASQNKATEAAALTFFEILGLLFA